MSHQEDGSFHGDCSIYTHSQPFLQLLSHQCRCVDSLKVAIVMMMMSSGLTTHQPMRVICVNDDDEFRFNDASTHEGHLRQNGELTWFCNETIIMISHKCIKCKTRTNLKIKAVILC